MFYEISGEKSIQLGFLKDFNNCFKPFDFYLETLTT